MEDQAREPCKAADGRPGISLERTAEAFAPLEAGGIMGKVVITVA
jgi:hypothetical protein